MSRRDRSNIFIFFIVLVIIGAAAYFFRSQDNRTPSNNANTNVTDEEAPAVGGPDQEENVAGGEDTAADESMFQSYNNEELGFSLQHASSVTQETKQEGVVTVYFDANSLSVLPADSLPLVESAFSSVKQTEVMVAGYPARRISATSQKDGSALEVLLLTIGNDLYYFQGTAGFLDTVEETFQLTEKKNSL